MKNKDIQGYINLIKRELERTQRQAADAVSRMDVIYAHLEDLEYDLGDDGKD